MRQARGFTLVELMVSFAILSVMLALLFQIVSSITGSWSKGKQLSDNLGKARISLDVISRDLQMGMFRKDLGAFTNSSGDEMVDSDIPPANYCFFTARTGGESRSLALVNYRLTTGSGVAPGTTLERQVLPVSWTNRNISFGSRAIPMMRQIAQGKSSDLATGILAFRMYFIHIAPNGTRSTGSIYKNNANLRTVSVGVALVALDEQTQKLLLYTNRLQPLVNENWALPPDLNNGIGAVWQRTLDEFWKVPRDVPIEARSGIRIFETVVPINTQDSE